MKFIHAADIHLDSPLHRLEEYEGAPVEQIRQASRRAFENLIELAIDESVDFMLIAGDLFDGDWKDYNTGLYFISRVKRLQDSGIPVFIISGNHDAAGKMTRSLPYPENVYFFSFRKSETKIIESLHVAIHGQSFSKSAVTDNLAAGYPDPFSGYFNIGLLHTSLTGRPGHETYAPCTLDDLINKGYDYWALGHVHQYEIVSDDPFVVFPGCIQGRHVRETGAKGCVLVTVGEEDAIAVDRHDIDVIRWERLPVDLEGAGDIDRCLDRFNAAAQPMVDRHAPNPIALRVTFAGTTAVHPRIASDIEQFTESIRSFSITRFGDRVWIEKIKIKTRPTTESVSNPGPIREMAELVETLMASDADLSELGRELAVLFQKLPSDYRQGESRLQPDDPAQIKDLVAQAHALLVHRMKKEAESQ